MTKSNAGAVNLAFGLIARKSKAMLTKFIQNEFPYDGTQLRSLFGYLDHGLLGDSVVSWVGACEIDFAHMVDGEDLLEKSEIRGGRMVHFILEKFHATLPEMVALQRLFAAIVKDVIVEKENGHPRFPIRRSGDDIYLVLPDGEGKLSISIATVSPLSGLVHFAVNVTNDGTPVRTASLEDLRFSAKEFAELVLSRFRDECRSIREATMKVKWVR